MAVDNLPELPKDASEGFEKCFRTCFSFFFNGDKDEVLKS
jgi:hypothetical protein